MSSKVEIIAITEPIQHAEGPFCDNQHETLYYVDTFKATAIRYHLKTKKLRSYKLEGRDSIGVIIPVADKPNQFVVAADRYVYSMDWNDNQGDKAVLKELVMVEKNKPNNQFNDGKVDKEGRLWLGTLTRNADKTVAPNGGSVFMINGDNLDDFEEKIKKTSISNGMAWSKDGKHFYFVDSQPRLVYSYDYNEARGQISKEKVIFDLNKHPELKGIPDGMEIDTDDNLWIALFGGHALIHVDPRTSTLIKVVEMPVTYVTSACFGGPNLDVLYVTTSRLHLDNQGIEKEPLAGSVFAVSNLGVRGLPPNRFVYENC